MHETFLYLKLFPNIACFSWMNFWPQNTANAYTTILILHSWMLFFFLWMFLFRHCTLFFPLQWLDDTNEIFYCCFPFLFFRIFHLICLLTSYLYRVFCLIISFCGLIFIFLFLLQIFFFLSFIYHFTFNVAIRSLWINTIRVLLFYNDEIYHFFKIIWFSLSADLFWSVAKWPDDFPCAKKMYLKEMYEENVFWNCLFGIYLQYNPHCDFLIRLNTFLSNFVRVFYQNLHSCLALLVLGIICFYIFESVAPVFRWSYLCFGFYSGLFWVWWIAVTLIFLLLFSLILSLIPFTIFHCFNGIVFIFSGCICRIANFPLL